MQALYLLALAPIVETLGDPTAYGVRRERCPADASEQGFKVLARHQAPQWILHGDMRACGDACSPAW
jgi:RNA-directed DNA polymerase